MKVLGTKRSPYAYKVMVMITEKGIPCEFKAAATSSAEVAEAKPFVLNPGAYPRRWQGAL